VIARTWDRKVPIEHADGFYQHLLATGVADYRTQAGCVHIQLWRRDAGAWARFVLSSLRESMEAIRRYAGEAPEWAVLYPGDDAFGLVPDRTVAHYDVLYMPPAGIASERHETEGL
jgi:hypothetical protein